MSAPASKAMAIRVCKLASDLVAAITLMKNAPVKSAVIESPERCGARYRSLKSPASTCVSITLSVHGEGVVSGLFGLGHARF
jgi:hypothetical protein